MNVDVINIKGDSTGNTIDLPEDIYGIEPNEHCVYLAVRAYNNAQRQGTHKAKERGDVRGSGKKIKRQKGTGTARAGDIKNPIFRGGGRVFGPRPRSYNIKLNKKVKRLARQSAFADKAQSDNILIVDSLAFDAPKTKDFYNFLASAELENTKLLVITAGNNRNAYLSARNIPGVEIVQGELVNTYQVVNADKLIIEEEAIDKINSLFA